MEDRILDQHYVFHEAIDDLTNKVANREKLIESARQLAGKRKEDTSNVIVKNFENLMVDFVKFYQPILQKIRTYRDDLQEGITELKSLLGSVKGILEVAKGIEGMSPKVRELETESDELEKGIKEKLSTIEKIKGLFDKIRRFEGEAGGNSGLETSSSPAGHAESSETRTARPSRRSGTRS